MGIRELELPISSIECFNLLVALRLWGDEWRGSTVLLFSDNWATVCAMESGRAQDPLIRAMMREAWMVAAVGDSDLVVRHLPPCRHGGWRTSSVGNRSQKRRGKRLIILEPGVEIRVPETLLRPPMQN